MNPGDSEVGPSTTEARSSTDLRNELVLLYVAQGIPPEAASILANIYYCGCSTTRGARPALESQASSAPVSTEPSSQLRDTETNPQQTS
jgi:hypothetical protein